MTNLLMIFTVDMMKVSKHLDWLSITLANNQKWRNFLPLLALHKSGRGRHGYAEAWLDEPSGTRIETGALDESMGTHITLGGQALHWFRDNYDWTDEMLVSRIQEWSGKCSRVDLAIDVFGASFTPETLNQDLLSSSAKIPAKTWRFIDGHRNGINGATVDTGSSLSDRRLRFYDKRAELRIKDGEAWVRLELQLRRISAKATIGACAAHGCSETISGAIGSYLSWSNTEYQTAIAHAGEYTMISPHQDTNRQKWLLGQVAQALASEITIHPDFLMKFMIAVRHFGEGKAKSDKS